MVEKGIREGIYDATHQYAKANKKYIKYWDVNNLYGWAMSQKLPVNGFKQVEETSQFNEDFIKSYNKNMIKGIFLKLIFNILKKCMNFIMIYHFTREI